jgi:EAL domain-containing protein (putative c-di-GMP-specific phosphodiesterase class I)/response regulator of citrate/malate metabolism/HPt (histidine-containing phosphotransfer) domain-containing protein
MQECNTELRPVFRTLIERLNALMDHGVHLRASENLVHAFQRSKAGDPSSVVAGILLDGLMDCLDCSGGLVGRTSTHGSEVLLQPEAVRGGGWPEGPLGLPPPAVSLPQHIALQRAWDEGEVAYLPSGGDREALLCAPVIRKGRVIGLLGLSGPCLRKGADAVLQLYRTALAAVLTLAPGRSDAVPECNDGVLVVEDDPASRAVFELQCHNLGCDAALCEDGEQAFACWCKARHPLVLIDKNLPGMNGIELVHRMRSHEREAGGARSFLVAITAEQDERELELFLQAGADDVLCKPVSIDNLAEVLTRRGLIVPVVASGDEQLPVFDLAQVASVTGGVVGDQLHGLVRLFVATARTELILCGRSLSLLNRRQVGLSMHKLKSSARAVGAVRFGQLAEAFERQSEQSPITSLEAMLYELQHELDAFEQAVRLYASDDGVVDGAGEAANEAHLEGDGLHRVLIVDDDVVASHFAAAMLSALGIGDVKVAGSGEAALDVLNEYRWQVDLIISDLRMPDFDGISFIRTLAEQSYGGRLAIGSGIEEELIHSVAEMATACGLNYCGSIRKPFSFNNLSVLLQKASRSGLPSVVPAVAPVVRADDIAAGLRNDEFEVHLQPIVDALSLAPHAFEALARWHGEHGFVPIESVIAVAEQHGLIGQLSELLFTKALICGAMLAREGFDMRLAINVSSSWLNDPHLPEFMIASCKATGFPVGRVTLELTESGAIADMAQALEILTRLRLNGFSLSIDDFGAGYSSLERLQRIPFSELKIDRGFVRKAVEYEQSRTVLAYTLEMARQLKLDTVAEGVETDADLQLVRELGCDSVQGWIVARPMPIDVALAWLRSGAH